MRPKTLAYSAKDLITTKKGFITTTTPYLGHLVFFLNLIALGQKP
jgi:hypothetical protein